MKTITSTDANRGFSRLLRDVAQGGEAVQITSRGRPVATLGPIDAHPQCQRESAKSRLLDRLAAQAIAGERNWTRDELYD